jgi:hypothetical protein
VTRNASVASELRMQQVELLAAQRMAGTRLAIAT